MNANLIKPPKSLLRLVGRAIVDYGMIRDGDRLLLGVSGGKDSLSLLHLLRHLQSYAPVRFELAVLTVDPEVPGFDPQPLKDYYDALGVPWHYEQQPILEQAKRHMDGDSFCAYCARMKRGIMYRLCREQGYGVLALGPDLAKAKRCAELLEKTAHVYSLALSTGREVTLLPQNIQDLMAKIVTGKQDAEIKRKDELKK